MTHYQSYSGRGYDRWAERSNQSTLGKVQKQFWFTKSAVIRKLGKKEDEHVVASDAELDAKIELFKAIELSTKELQVLLADYQNKICILAQEENALGRLLKEFGKQDKSRAGEMMVAVGKSLSYTAQQRIALRNPLVRLFQEVDTFHSRAVEDTGQTVAEMEKIRTEYRGALMWMKNISQDINPDYYPQLEKFREVQGTVKDKKSKFDQLKIKSLQKTDLLAASRCSMFSHALILYQNSLITFFEKISKTLNSVNESFKNYEPYDFKVIKELAELKVNSDSVEKDLFDLDDKTFFNAEYHDDAVDGDGNTCEHSSKKTDSLVNLFEKSEEEEDEDEKGDEKKKKTCATGLSLSEAVPKKVTKESSNDASFDLLTGFSDIPGVERETQEMLRELFESPVHQIKPSLHTNDGKGDLASLSELFKLPGHLPSGPQPNLQQAFLPSQLLDFGIHNWGPEGQANSPQPPAAPRVNDYLSGEISDSLTTSPLLQSKPESASDLKAPSTAQDSRKVEWYKVFQDIDPLSDPSNSFFGSLIDENKKC